MKTLRRIWDDVQKGENVDQYLTIVVALVLVALTLIGLPIQNYLEPITLAVLALLAIGSLGNRYKLEEVLDQGYLPVDRFFRTQFPESYSQDLTTASEIWIVGISLRRTIQGSFEILESRLRSGAKLRALLIDPNSSAVELAVARNYADRSVEPKRTEIAYGLKLLCALRELAPNHVEIRAIKRPLAYGVTAINPDTGTGRFYIEHYGFRVASDSIPRFVLNASDGRWYKLYRRELEELWMDASVWPCDP